MQGDLWSDLVYMANNPVKSAKNFAGNYIVPAGIAGLSMGAEGVTALERALGAQQSMIPLEYRTYLSSVGNPFTAGRELTEADLFPADLELYKKLITEKEATKKTKNSNARKTPEGVVYGYDYATGYDKSKVPGKRSVERTSGKFEYKLLPDGKVVTDTYDFPAPEQVEKKMADYGEVIVDRLAKGDIMGAASAYGAKVLPSKSGAGRKVKIKIKDK